MIVSLPEARAQCRLEDDYPEAQLAPYIAAAEDSVQAHLNRRVFATQNDLDAALDALPDEQAAARDAYEQAQEAAEAESDPVKRDAMLSVAQKRLEAAELQARRTLHGVVVTPVIKAAALLTVEHLFANRGAVLVGVTAAELPMGVRDLLRRDRLGMMP